MSSKSKATPLDILTNIEDFLKNGKINSYLVRFSKKKDNSDFSVIIPGGDIWNDFSKQCIAKLKEFQNVVPIEYKKDNLSSDFCFIGLHSFQNNWNRLLEIIIGSKNLSEKIDSIKNCHLLLIELEYKEKKYYFLCNQPSSDIYKLKNTYFINADNLIINNKKLITLNFDFDFIVDISEEKVFMINKENTFNIMNYTEEQKNIAETNIDKIEELKFIKNPEFIKENLGYKYVYIALSEIFEEEYFKEIKKADGAVLKQRLLARGAKYFSEKDFENNKIKLTKHNLEKVMKVLCSGYRYNFFYDQVV